MWKASVKEIDGEILCVSQFTLLANIKKGKPDFHRAMSTEPSRETYATFLENLGQAYKPDRIKGPTDLHLSPLSFCFDFVNDIATV
ncbi:hypothetical protein C0992_008280 [Termitomyces sp. T32_za158]|nr:hypothetical protein C0992_008280 [Termitomyces sp. T32_za158]